MKSLLPGIMLLAAAMDGLNDYGRTEKKKKRTQTYKGDNPHGFTRFETDGYVTYSYNQTAHDEKYADYLKKKKS